MAPSSFAPRLLHPGAWWLWALGLATAASRTTNPILLILIAAVAGLVVAERRAPGPWAKSFGAFLRLGLIVVGLRVILEVFVGSSQVGTPLFTLPQIQLPSWIAGIHLGGVVTADALLLAVYDGLRLAVMLACVGAANALVHPSRLLRIVPAALYEVGVAVVVCLTFAPMMVSDAVRIRGARRLRGRATKGLRAWTEMAMPLFNGALERSIALAASMDSRGYGRGTGETPRARAVTAVLVITGLFGAVIGLYALLQGASPGVEGVPVLGWPMLLAGTLMAILGGIFAGRRVLRTRYRPDPWGLPEWIVSTLGFVPAVVFVALGSAQILVGPASPPAWPDVSIGTTLAVIVAAFPAIASPRVPHPQTQLPAQPREVPA
ncbi:MAG: energy-coupling factor transporter transmembrane component T [Candidatus Nanopelagicales bacterium]|nr:energy-coupling factor transporter transmembrane component T [Candidatus Nanopelagicales bacterium]MDZ4250535.1 energy-coupling factor transporter transmembrane component T [Candidatus Nanopelagicales bacterium]